MPLDSNIADGDVQDPTSNWASAIDLERAGGALTWHAALGGGPHVTAEALERLEADTLFVSLQEARA